MRRIFGTVGCWALAVPCAIWALARIFGLERGWPWVQLMAFTPYVGICALLVAAGALLGRRVAPAVLALVASVALAVVVIPRSWADGGSTAAGPVLRVLTSNLLAGSGDERQVLALAERLDVDVLAFQEFTPADAAGLAAAGFARRFQYQALYPAPGTGGSALVSRYPFRGPSGVRVHDIGGFQQAHATVDVPGAGPVLTESVHPGSPWGPPAMRAWEREVREQPPATVDGPLRILLGDFNATLDHRNLRRLLDTGYRDAAGTAGTGLRSTWPYDEKWYIPGVTLDHVLVDRRIGVRAARPYRIHGSDHKAVYAELVLPEAG